jgi:uncharacterized protein involved in outer membrane biogenesis
MKALRRIGIGVLVAVVVVVVVALFLLNPLIKSAVEKGGPAITKTSLTLEKVALSPFSGNGELKGLVIGNPEGFKTPSAIQLGSLKISLDPGSVLSDKMVIHSISIEGPEITYEAGLKGSNIGKLLENMEGEKPAEQKPEEQEPAEKPETPGKKVVIEDFVLSGGRIHLSAALMQGKAMTVPLPTVHLTDIGKEKGGASVREVVSRVMRAVADAVTGAVAGSVQIVGKGAEAVGDAAKEGVQAAGGAALKGAEAVGDAAKKTTEAAGEAAKKSAEAVGGAAKKGLDGIVGGAKKLTGKE